MGAPIPLVKPPPPRGRKGRWMGHTAPCGCAIQAGCACPSKEWRGPARVVDLAPAWARSGPGIPKGATPLPKGGGRAQPRVEKAGEILRGVAGPDLDGIAADDDAALIELFAPSPGVSLSADGPREFAAVAPVVPPVTPGASPGVNAPKVLTYFVDDGSDTYDAAAEVDDSVTVYGTTETILDDLAHLGVRFFRQPVGTGTLWPEGVEVPVITEDTAHPEYGGDLMYEQVFGSPGTDAGIALKTRLVELFFDMSPPRSRAPGRKVVLTLFSSGDTAFGGPDASLEYPWEIVPDPRDPKGIDTVVETRGPRSIAWSSGHLEAAATTTLWQAATYTVNQYVSADSLDFTTLHSYPVSAAEDSLQLNAEWVLGTLDLRSPYKLKYLYYIGYAYGRLLLDVNAECLRLGLGSVWDKILAVEVFNEINGSNQFMNYEDSSYGYLSTATTVIQAHARFWSLAAREIVRGLQHALSTELLEDDGITPRQLPLWLPSLLSYKATPRSAADIASGADIVAGDAPTFASVLYFQQRLCEYLVSDFGNDNKLNVGAPPVDFTWSQNQDYHYYNYRDDTAPGLILRLAAELADLRATMAPTAAGGTGVSTLAAHTVTLSVCETGAAADAGSVAGLEFPYLRTGLTDPIAERFQARDVWRRLAVAATSARSVCWHTHMSLVADTAGQGAAFLYLGLRNDSGKFDNSPPSSAAQRLSWWAYQRFAGLAVDRLSGSPFAGQIIARFVNPRPSTTDRYIFDANSSDAAYVAIAIHFIRLVEGVPEHWYLLMIDPTAPVMGVSPTATLTPFGGGRAEFQQWDTIPKDDKSTYITVATGDDRNLPLLRPDSSWDTYNALDPHALSYDVPLSGPDTNPVLVRCTVPCGVTLA